MKHFSTEELKALEMLEIKGGNGNSDDVIQNQCPNNVCLYVWDHVHIKTI